MEKHCAYCQTLFTTENPRKMYCQQHCADLMYQQRQREKWGTRICELCGTSFLPTLKTQRFCNPTCSAKWRMSLPEAKARTRRMGIVGQQARRGCKDPKASARMKANNPAKRPDVQEKMSKALSGRTWLSQRGGKGTLTEPQKLLATSLCLPMEYSIVTRPVKHLFASLPHSYAVDLACPEVKVAIEVDGNSHKTKKWKYLDQRKTEVLNALGWLVLRYWNREVTEETDRVIAEIRSSITLRLQTTTTTSQTAS